MSELSARSGATDHGPVQRWIGQARQLAAALETTKDWPDGDAVQKLRERLASVEDDRELLAKQFVEMDQRLGRLVNLYVATYQLHSSLDPSEVQAAVADVALNIIGAEQFVLLVRRASSQDCDVVLTQGLDVIESAIFPEEGYSGGDPLVDATLADGLIRIETMEGSCATAAVPLLVESSVVGVLVIVKLFDHRGQFVPDDREILDMLASHAGSAIFAAQLLSSKERKLRALETSLQSPRPR